ncbi:ABC transporter substrate-binding protein [Streptococcus pneumoniae]|nr:ABC transporter substrate-binding protein [Streptococcus pneumoniae]UKP52821.1 ABC transporter substrate-binding protein [Streptococcus pneumoniae]
MFSEKEFHYESCSKITSPLLVVGILLTSLISLHQLKADKKRDVFRIGISQFITHQSLDATREGFVDELAKQGYVEGENIEIDLQNAQGEQRNLKTISQQLAESSDVVLAIARPSAQSLANTTQTTPVIFSAVTDPVSAKLVESREHPGGNVTGTSDQSSDAISTQVNLIKKVLPKAKTIGILYTQSEPNSVVQKDEDKRLLKEKGFTVVEKTILDSNNVKAAAESLMAEVDMVFVPTDNIISSTMETVKQVSIKHKVPVFGGSTEMIAVGGLYNYGTNYEELGRQTARMLIRVLKGEKPENIAVELPEKLELHTNQEMADALGIDISKLEGKE